MGRDLSHRVYIINFLSPAFLPYEQSRKDTHILLSRHLPHVSTTLFLALIRIITRTDIWICSSSTHFHTSLLRPAIHLNNNNIFRSIFHPQGSYFHSRFFPTAQSFPISVITIALEQYKSLLEELLQLLPADGQIRVNLYSHFRQYL